MTTRPDATPDEERERLLEHLHRNLGSGVPLGDAVRRRAESWFGRDLGDVRLHDSEQAAALASRLGAEAFTVKGHVFGAAEGFNPETARGRGLLAHEITHVVQQTRPGEAPHGSDGGAAGIHFQARRATADRVSLQVSQDTVQRATEREAQLNEALAVCASGEQQRSDRAGNSPPVDTSEIVDRVYRMMARDFAIERERGVFPPRRGLA